MIDNNSVFTDYQDKKAKVRRIAELAFETGWIDSKTRDEVVSKVDRDVLTIGIIGQTNSGKSTFLNALLFGCPVLPISSTPMTAGLSIITYGREASLSVDFYSTEEWQDIVSLAARNARDGDDPQLASAIDAAKEMVKASVDISGELSSLLGTTRVDDFSNLVQYVGAGGKYVSIVKYVKIFLPYEWLKGVEIVDTPGFNDPVVSREARTADFLKRADVALMMLYAGRAFDSTDAEIIFDKARRVGVGRIILVVNKYDVQLLSIKPETPEQLKVRVKNAVEAYLRASDDFTLHELLGGVEPMPVSALMALLSKMTLVEINADEALRSFYEKMAYEFSLKNPAELLSLSLIVPVENKIRSVISSQKEELVFRKPATRIRIMAKDSIDSLKEKILMLEQKLEELSIPDDELEDRIQSYEKAKLHIDNAIEVAKEDLGTAYARTSRKLMRQLENLVDDVKRDCMKYTDLHRWGKLNRKINQRIEDFMRREWPRAIQDFPGKLDASLRSHLDDLSEKVSGALRRCLVNFDDVDEIVSQFERVLKRSLNREFENPVLVQETLNVKIKEMSMLAVKVLTPFINIWYIPATLFDGGRAKARTFVTEAFDQFYYALDNLNMEIVEHKDAFVGLLGGDNANALMAQLIDQAEAARGTKQEKMQKIIEVDNQLKKARLRLSEMENSYAKLKEIIG